MLRRQGRIPIYAIVRSGGKQYRVETDQVLDVDRLEADVGSTVELTEVLLLSDGNAATVGAPTVADAKVVAEVLEHGRDKKITVFKYKNKTRYRRKKGHRQNYTRLAIKQMGIGKLEAIEAKPKPKRAARKKAADTDEQAQTAELTAEGVQTPEAAVTGAPETAEKPGAPKRVRKPRKATAKDAPAPVAATDDATGEASPEADAGASEKASEE